MCYDDNWRRGNGPPGAPWRDFWHRTPALRPWSLSCAGFSARSAEPASSEAQMPIHYDYPPGVTAIQPSRQVPDRSQAAYGRAEVEQYLESNPRLMRGVPGGPSPKLGTVEFLPASQVRARQQCFHWAPRRCARVLGRAHRSVRRPSHRWGRVAHSSSPRIDAESSLV